MHNPHRVLLALCLLTTSLAACASPPANPTATVLPPRATPAASEITAGICGEFPGPELVMVLEPGIPDPRCAIVRAEQVLHVVNRTGAAVTVTLGEETVALAPEAEAVFQTPFGQALLPGVHYVRVDPCCGGEIWWKGD